MLCNTIEERRHAIRNEDRCEIGKRRETRDAVKAC
jgi:hypothetical protein